MSDRSDNVPSWLVKDMDRPTQQQMKKKKNVIAERAERAKQFLERKRNKRSSSSNTSIRSLPTSSPVYSSKDEEEKDDIGIYRKGDRVRITFGKRKGKLGRILGRGKKSKSKWRVRVGGRDVVEYDESRLEKFQKAVKVTATTETTKKEKNKTRPLSITVRRARRASQERIRRSSSAVTPPSPSSSTTTTPITVSSYEEHVRRQSSSAQENDSNNKNKIRPKSDQIVPSKYQLRYSLQRIRKHKSYPRRLRSKKNSRPPIPQWVLQEMGRTSSTSSTSSLPKSTKLQSSLSNSSILSSASPQTVPSPPISPSVPSGRQSWKRRISSRLSLSNRSKTAPPSSSKKKLPPPIPKDRRIRTRSDGRSGRSLKEILSNSDVLSPLTPLDSPMENDSSELEDCWHTIQEIATSELKHLHFMIVLRDLYFEPLKRIDADNQGHHTNMSTDRLRVVSSMLEGGWQHSDAEALFRGLESVQDMSNEIVTVLRPLLDNSVPKSARSRLVRSVMREFLKRLSSPDEDSLSPLSGAYVDFCANTPFATRKLTSLCNRNGLGEAFQKYLKLQRHRQADILIRLGAHEERDRPFLRIIRLDAVLIKPVQRIGRYQLLLGDVLRRLPKNHSTREVLEDCREAAARSAADVDDIVADTEEAARLWSVYERLSVPQIEDENSTDDSARIVSATTSLPTHLLAQRDQLVTVLRRLVTPHRRFLREMNVLLAFDCYGCSRYHDNHSRECVSCGASYCVSCKKKYMHKLATKTWKCTRCNVREEMRRVTGFSKGISPKQSDISGTSSSSTPQISLKHAKSLRSVLLGGGKINRNPTMQRSFYRNLMAFNKDEQEDEDEEEELVPSPTFESQNSSAGDYFNNVVDRVVDDGLDDDDRAAENFASQFDFSGDSTSDSSISVGVETPAGRPRCPEDSSTHRRRVLVFSDFFIVASPNETSKTWFFNSSTHEGEGARLELDIHVPPIHLGRIETRPRARSRLASLRDRRHEPKLPTNAIRIVPPAFAWGRRQRATSSFLQLNADGARSSGYSFVIWCESKEEKQMLWSAMGRK